jgi:ATP-dependent DNA helicase DinG
MIIDTTLINYIKNIMTNPAYWNFNATPRPNQIAALDWLFEQDKKYLLLEAPVGTGKSFIGMAFASANKTDTSYILTPQIILQKQYEDSFNPLMKNIASLYGKSNYHCSHANASCEIGGLLKQSCAYCPHKTARSEAINKNHTILNYKLALTLFSYTEAFLPRDLIIFDECHTLEENLISFDAHTISYARCKKYDLQFKAHTSLLEAVKWVKEYYLGKMLKIYSTLEPEANELKLKDPKEITKTDAQKIKTVEELCQHIDATNDICSQKDIEDNYILTNDMTMFCFKRLTGEYSFEHILHPMAKKFLFMSSTILNKDGFCSDLGLDKSEVAFMSLDSEFDKKNRPVYYMPQMKMNYTWKNNEPKKKQMLNTINALLEMHENESGIIHTGNFEVSNWLVNEIESKHEIFHHNPDKDTNVNRNNIINEFQEYDKPSVLISPSCTEGLDLKEDLGRFAIIVKVPFGNLGDQWIKKRMEMSNEWYMRQALIDIIQGGGRIVRSADDKGVVYILDESWNYLYFKSNYMIPKWWKDAYHKV